MGSMRQKPEGNIDRNILSIFLYLQRTWQLNGTNKIKAFYTYGLAVRSYPAGRIS